MNANQVKNLTEQIRTGFFYRDSMDYKAYRDQWNRATQGEIFPSPTHVDVELASVCNFRCPMCPQAETEVAWEKRFMDTDTALSILQSAAAIGVLSVKLNWRGESIIHPEFPRIVRYAKLLGFQDVMLNTNGYYESDAVREAVHSIDTLIFSVDTLDAEKAKRLRPGGDLKTILDNVEIASRASRIYGSPKRVRVNFTRQKENWDEEDSMRAWCNAIDVEFYSKPVVPRNPPKVGQYFDESKIEVKGRKNCGFPFARLTVAHDGRVAPCCVPWDDKLFVGNLNKESLLDIWDGASLARIRDDAEHASYTHPTCIGCTSWASYEIEIKDGTR